MCSVVTIEHAQRAVQCDGTRVKTELFEIYLHVDWDIPMKHILKLMQCSRVAHNG